ncbi:hypothetical protein ACHAXT_005878 [Thalassiosira profunda]
MAAVNADRSDAFVYTSLDDADADSITDCKRDLAHVLCTIEKAAYAAGEIALSTAGQIAVKSTKANVRDLVTESDVECQRLIKDLILQEFPDDVFLGEEDIDLSGDSSSASSEALKGALGIAEGSGGEDRLLFVVDPIDGTTNFQAAMLSSRPLVPYARRSLARALEDGGPSIRICRIRLHSAAAATEGGGGKQLRHVALGIAGGTTLAALGGVAYLNHHVGGGDGLWRTVSFYSLAIPKYIEYRLHMLMDSPDEVWDRLHEDTSKAGLDKIMELQGFYVKSGQMCAANIGNAFPPIWQDTMAPLQDECPSRPFAVVKQIVESEFGKSLNEIFATFEETPIGAASIGQVHRATLKDGSKVVVKIMYPGVEDVFRGDVRTIKMFAQVAQPVHVPPLIEIEKQFMTEFDYEKEAEQLDKVRRNMEAANIAGDASKLCAIPKPHLDLCTKRVLVMNELKGNKLVDELKRDMKRQMARVDKSLDKFGDEKEMEQSFAKEFQLGENGPTAAEYDAFIRLLDAKRRASNAYAALYNLSVGWLPGVKRREYEGKSSLPINHAKLIDELLHIHGHQVCRLPVQQIPEQVTAIDSSALTLDHHRVSDPHPGNVMLLGVEEGRPQLGLIDYGQVKVLTKEERLLFCKMIVALANDDKDQICDLLKEAGYRSEKMDKDIMYKFARVAYDEDNAELTEGQHIQLYMEHLHDEDPVEHLPQQYIMASRVSILLRGLGHAVHQSRSVAKAWKPIAEVALAEEGQP